MSLFESPYFMCRCRVVKEDLFFYANELQLCGLSAVDHSTGCIPFEYGFLFQLTVSVLSRKLTVVVYK